MKTATPTLLLLLSVLACFDSTCSAGQVAGHRIRGNDIEGEILDATRELGKNKKKKKKDDEEDNGGCGNDALVWNVLEELGLDTLKKDEDDEQDLCEFFDDFKDLEHNRQKAFVCALSLDFSKNACPCTSDPTNTCGSHHAREVHCVEHIFGGMAPDMCSVEGCKNFIYFCCCNNE